MCRGVPARAWGNTPRRVSARSISSCIKNRLKNALVGILPQWPQNLQPATAASPRGSDSRFASRLEKQPVKNGS